MERDIIATQGDHRVSLVLDTDPWAPEDHGATPILRLLGGWYGKLEAVENHDPSYAVPINVQRAWEQFDREVWERYLRIFHGVTRIEWLRTRDADYVSFDPSAWRDVVGVNHREIAMQDSLMTEWRAYIEGEVFGAVVERRRTRMPVLADLLDVAEGADEDITFRDVYDGAVKALEDDEGATEWIEAESLWGLYGYEWANRRAMDLLHEQVAAYVPQYRR